MAKRPPHREDIKAEIRKRGSTLAEISEKAGLGRRSASYALVVPMPTANRAIAAFLDKPLHELWPRWYDQHGNRIRSRTPLKRTRNTPRRHRQKSSTKFA